MACLAVMLLNKAIAALTGPSSGSSSCLPTSISAHEVILSSVVGLLHLHSLLSRIIILSLVFRTHLNAPHIVNNSCLPQLPWRLFGHARQVPIRKLHSGVATMPREGQHLRLLPQPCRQHRLLCRLHLLRPSPNRL